jgi:hypothetical protein
MAYRTYGKRIRPLIFLIFLIGMAKVSLAQQDSAGIKSQNIGLTGPQQDSLKLKAEKGTAAIAATETVKQRKRLLAPRPLHRDSLILKNGNTITGEIKLFDKGVLNIKTPYSKTDFVVKWAGIQAFYSKRAFLIEIENGQRANGTLQFLSSEQKLVVTEPSGYTLETTLNRIVYLRPLQYNFWSHVKLGADLGLSISKANHLNSLSFNTDFGYITQKWQSDGYYNVTSSSQDSVEPTKRSEASLDFKYYMKRSRFISTSLSFLSNTEQAVGLRSVGKVGANKFLRRTNQTHWGVGGGLSFNWEVFTNEAVPRTSLEGYVGTELSRFALGNLSFLNSLYIYPSLTEAGRWRSDIRLDNKYDIRGKFYVKLGFTLNYDNQPAVTGKEIDYVIGFSIGWKLW